MTAPKPMPAPDGSPEGHSMLTELLPCPFCSGPARMGHRAGWPHGECMDCDSEGPKAVEFSDTPQAADQKAIAAWNTRQAQEGWQPIASAPKDGTRFLALWPYSRSQCAFETYWDDDESQGDKPNWHAPDWGYLLDGSAPIGWMQLPTLSEGDGQHG